jgi:alpha-amylase
MPWDHVDEAVLAHWRALGRFRARHVAIARGVHRHLADRPYAFSRIDVADRVVVAVDVPAGAAIPLGAAFADGDALRDAYTGAAYIAHGGAITALRASRVVLLERAAR